jgi:hypothetical protein|tara:strand:- start:503 stop:979 length:477 start_codon:yes stop_codon:yes gene_type:complete
MNVNADTLSDTLSDNNNELDIKLFYIDTAVNHDKFLIVKVNYERFFSLSYDDIKKKLDLFYTFYINKQYTKKIIIILDIKLIKNILHTNNNVTRNPNIINNIYLIDLIKYINNNYNDYIIKCLLVHYTHLDKQIILLSKQILKSIDFMNKVELYLQNS